MIAYTVLLTVNSEVVAILHKARINTVFLAKLFNLVHLCCELTGCGLARFPTIRPFVTSFQHVGVSYSPFVDTYYMPIVACCQQENSLHNSYTIEPQFDI